jgi:hypothetical protein
MDEGREKDPPRVNPSIMGGHVIRRFRYEARDQSGVVVLQTDDYLDVLAFGGSVAEH